MPSLTDKRLPELQVQNPPQETHSFSQLPAELRLLIWSHAILPYLSPRVHSVLRHPQNHNVFASNNHIPNILHICRESRSLYLRKSQAVFAYGAYINFEIDTIFLADCPSTFESAALIRPPQSDGLEALRNLREDRFLADRIQKLALRNTIWLRPRLCDSIDIEITWTLIESCELGALKDLYTVFGGDEPRRENVKLIDIPSTPYIPARIVTCARLYDGFLKLVSRQLPILRHFQMPNLRYVVLDTEKQDQGSMQLGHGILPFGGPTSNSR